MKYLFIAISLIISTLGNAADIEEVLRKPNLRILDIGNSFTADATRYLANIISANGSDVSDLCLYTANRGSAAFKDWVNVYNDADKYEYTISKVVGGLTINTTTGKYGPYDGSGLRSLLNDNVWDLIIIHQRSIFATNYDPWDGNGNEGYLNQLLTLLRETQPQAIIGTYVIHSYSSDSNLNTEHSAFLRWQKIANAVNEMTNHHSIALIIPYGTAVQNLRQSRYNNEKDLTRDGAHLAYGLPSYAASGCYYEAVFAPRFGVSFLGNTYRVAFGADKDPIKFVTVDDDNAAMAQKAALLAIADWLQCRNPEDEAAIGQNASAAFAPADIYTLTGIRVCTKGDTPRRLPSGIYISGDRKWVVR